MVYIGIVYLDIVKDYDTICININHILSNCIIISPWTRSCCQSLWQQGEKLDSGWIMHMYMSALLCTKPNAYYNNYIDAGVITQLDWTVV